MATFGQLKTAVSKRLLDTSNTSVSVSDVATALNDAINFYKFTRFWFNETEETVTLTALDPVVPIPVDLLFEIPKDGFVIDYSSQRYVLCKKSPGQYDHVNVEASAIPQIYTFRNNQYEVYPYPDQAYSLVVRYLKDYDEFMTDGSQDDTSNDFTNYAERLIQADALSRLHAELRQDEKMESYYTARAEVELKNLLKRTNNMTAPGELIIETII